MVSRTILAFGEFRFNMSTRELARAERGASTTPLPLGSRAAHILFLLLQQPGELVTKNEIVGAVWPNLAIEDSNLTVQISAVRRALDVGRNGASAISTVPGRGYRFTLPVQELENTESALAPVTAQNLDVDDATAAAPDQASAPASLPASFWARFGFARMPGWVPVGAVAVTALLGVVVLGLRQEGYFARGPNAAAVTDSTTYYLDRGRAFASKSDFDRAMADFTEVIRLDPMFGRAYRERATVRRYKGDYDGAIADAGKAVELLPAQHLGYLERGNGYLAKGDFDRAIADFNTALRIAPISDESFFGRGQAHVFSGDMTTAQADFQSSIAINPKWPLPALWLAVAQRRGKAAGEGQQAAPRSDLAAWPALVLRMLLGEATPAETLAVANNGEPVTRRGQLCQATFYGGELALSRDAADEAARLFRGAADECPPTYVERPAAATELRALGNPR